MAFASHRTRFKGELHGLTIDDLLVVDYERDKVKDRLEFIKEKHKKVSKFYEEYIDEHYKVDVNTNDNLSSDINVFKALEKDANYLLNSLDIPRDKQYSYSLLTQEEFDKAVKKENKADLYQDGVIEILKPAFKNDYINMDLKITKADLKEGSELGQILRDYDVVMNHLKDEMNNLKSGEGSYLKLYQIKNMLGSMKGDMLDSKKMLKGITRPSTKLGDIGAQPDYYAIDYSKPEHIKELIKNVRLFGEIHPDNVLSHFAYDIEFAIKVLLSKGRLDSKDLEIIEGVNAGVSMRKLSEELGMKHQSISERFNKIVDKIAMFYTYVTLEKI